MTSDFVVILCTAPDDETAKSLARGLVEARLAACVNAVTKVVSTYRWKGNVETETEVQLLIKTRRTKFDEVAAWIDEHHPYEVPEIIATPVTRGLGSYIDWVKACTRKA